MKKSVKRELIATKVAHHLVGRKIAKVRYMTETESKLFGWSGEESCLVFILDNGEMLIPCDKYILNGPGAVVTSIKELPVIPVAETAKD